MIDELELYRCMYRIRRFEETVLEEFKRGVFSGTTHTYIGEEADAAGVISALQTQDVILTNHRCHGHFLAYGGEMRALFAEMMGKATGVCGGRGGSQHLHWRNLYSNGIQGGIVPIAVGMALAEKRKETNSIAVVFIGDGTLGQGVVYESLNMASLWNAPLLIVVENNHIAQTTRTLDALAGSVSARFTSFNIQATELDTSDVMQILPEADRMIKEIRSNCHPQALILNTARFAPHSKGDDTRSTAEVAQLRAEHDPLKISELRLDAALVAEIHKGVEIEVQGAFQQALNDPVPVWEECK